jgi:hypothetical protein
MSTPESQALQATDTQDKGADASGRPSVYSAELGDLICARLASGETLSHVCRTAGMPARQTVLRWRRNYPAFGVEYTLARADAMEVMADEIIDISDDSTLDVVTKRDQKGREFEAVDHENIQRDRLRVDTRKFLMSKVARHVYGDRVSHEHSGEVNQRHTIELSDRERMRRLASFMLEDKRAGITIEQTEPARTMSAGHKDTMSASKSPAAPSPADIIKGR